MAKKKIKLEPVHPGEFLQEDFMEPLGISINALARDLHVPPNHVSGIVNRKRGISARMSLRLARYFGTSERFWMNLQSRYDLEVEKDKLGRRLIDEVHPVARVG